jgi:hypothetical protein
MANCPWGLHVNPQVFGYGTDQCFFYLLSSSPEAYGSSVPGKYLLAIPPLINYSPEFESFCIFKRKNFLKIYLILFMQLSIQGRLF